MRRRGERESGFTLVALMIILIVLNVAVATAMQLWSKIAQREQEEELIFRGLQYAEAIRVYQLRYNRPPTSLDELMEARPRVLRQRWADPLSESGEWKTILAGSGSDVTQVAGGNAPGQAPANAGRDDNSGFGSGPLSGQQAGGQRAGGQQRPGQARRPRQNRGPGQQRPGGQRGFGSSGAQQGGFGSGGGQQNLSGTGAELDQAFDESSGSGFGNSGFGSSGSSFAADAEQTQIGPIEGVRPTATGQAAKHFLGMSDYSSWEFRAQMMAEPRVSPEGVPLMPRLDPSALGRPFPSWLSVAPGSTPHGGAAGDGPADLVPEASDDDW